MKHRNPSVHQAGVSLIELLISLTIGLVILTAIGTAYLNTTNTTRQREDQSQLNEPARNVMRLLRQNLMQAGYVDIFDLDALNNFRAASLFRADPGSAGLRLANMYIRDPATEAAAGPINAPLTQMFPGITPLFGCDGAMNNTTPFGIATAGAVQGCGTASATRHTLQIAYQGVPLVAANPDSSLSVADVTTGEGLDCLQQLPPAADVVTVINRFSISNASELQCEGSGAAGAQPLAEGVEEFVLRYQMSAPGVKANGLAAGGSQQRYVNASDVAASDQGWAGVTAVEICMVSATSNAQGAAAGGTAELQPTRPTCTRNADGVFDENIARAAGDRRLWKRYTSVVSVRNAVFASPL
jgi:type IV pilus assembly protein PilW